MLQKQSQGEVPVLDIDIYTSVESLPKTSKTDSTFNDWASEQ